MLHEFVIKVTKKVIFKFSHHVIHYHLAKCTYIFKDIDLIYKNTFTKNF